MDADPFTNFSTAQYHQLMTTLSNHMVSAKVDEHKDTSSTSYLAGLAFQLSQKLIHPMRSCILDSGASQHICSNISIFASIRPIKNITVTLPNGIHIPVHFSRNIHLILSLHLKEVLHVPQFKFNLLSVSALVADTTLTVSFLHDSFVIQDPHTKQMIGKGERVAGLYILDLDNLTQASQIETHSAIANHVTAQTWHTRLGHLSSKRLAILRAQLHYGIPKCKNKEPCYICPVAKHRRLHFVSHNHLSQFPFDLIHCDIWGLYHISSSSGHQYFLTLVDDCTRFTWVYLLK